jgi:rare lipoprotein A
MRRNLLLLLSFVLAPSVAAAGDKAQPSASGIASVYSSSYAGSKTASGETNRLGAMTAAHRTLPFGTMVRVTNKRNGKAVVVRINDRGPFLPNRVIDLSPAAATSLGFSGLAPVSLAVESGR